MIKITRNDGTIIELSDVEELPAVMPLITGGEAATMTITAEPEPAPESPVQQFQRATAPEPESAQQQPLEGMPAKPQRPKHVYLTQREATVMGLLRKYPEGLTTSQIAELMGMDHNNVSAMVSNLRSHRPYRDTAEPLIVAVSNHVMKATGFGMRARFKISARPSSANRQIGWPS